MEELFKIEQIFERMMEEKIFVIEDRNASYHTYTKVYPRTVKSLFKKAQVKYAIEAMNEISEDMIFEMIDEKIENYHTNLKFSESHNISALIAAMTAFQKGVLSFEAYPDWDVINYTEVREYVKMNGVKRRGAASQTMRAIPEEAIAVIDRLKNEGNDVKNRKMVVDMAIVAVATGARISSLYKMRKRDIDLEKGICYFYDAKGGKDYTANIDLDFKNELLRIMNGKNNDEKLFVWKKKNGQFMSLEKVTETVNYYIRRATEHLKKQQQTLYKNQDGSKTYVKIMTKFTFHSFRKAYAFKRLVHYLNEFTSFKKMREWQSELLLHNPAVLKKINALYKRVNKGKKGKWRDLKLNEYAIFAASLDLGHERNDVIGQFYANLNAAKKYLKTMT
jgi:integrase